MVTCPWCGTNYIEFQSNCKNCGGPLNLPVEEAASQGGEESLPTPPPPPRPIADGYAGRLMMADGWSLSGGVFVLLGVIFISVGIPLTIGVITAFVGLPFWGLGLLFLAAGGYMLYWRYQEARKTLQVLRNGEATQGFIDDVEENLSVAVDDQHPWVIRYHFEVGEQTYQGSVTTLNPPGPQLQPGKAACVLHLPQAPEQNALYPHP